MVKPNIQNLVRQARQMSEEVEGEIKKHRLFRQQQLQQRREQTEEKKEMPKEPLTVPKSKPKRSIFAAQQKARAETGPARRTSG